MGIPIDIYNTVGIVCLRLVYVRNIKWSSSSRLVYTNRRFQMETALTISANHSNVERYSFVSFGANRQNRISIMFNFVVDLLQNEEKQTLDKVYVF